MQAGGKIETHPLENWKPVDRFEAMSVLVQAVETGSLSAAGRKLGLPLATVSRKVAELEAHLKTRLVIRSARGLILTDAGRAFMAAAKPILEQLQEAERTAGGEYMAPTGDLVAAAPVVFGRLHVLPVAAEFLAAYPDIDLQLRLSDRMAHLVEDQVDVALRIGALPDSSLTATRIGAVRPVVCASPAYLAAHGRPKTPSDLTGRDCITFDGMCAPDHWTFGKALDVPIHSRLVVSTADAAIEAAVAGVGPTRILSYQVAERVAAGTLEVLLEDFEPESWPVHLVYNGHARLPLKLRAFLDFAGPRLRARLA
jgi:DNA-binding transcriptional LysR family regulator